MEDKNRTFYEESPTYRTGSTHPPKGHRGLWVCLLIPVILICGLIGLLGGLRIRMFWEAGGNEPVPVQFSDQGGTNVQPTIGEGVEVIPSGHFSLGFTGEDVSRLWQSYYHLPQGVIVTKVENSETGLCRGDILLYLGDQRITGIEGLNAALKQYQPGDPVKFVIYRGGAQQVLTLTVAK